MRRAEITPDYYRTVAPFFAAEVKLRTDVPEWVGSARRLGARRILDLGAGRGRMGQALLADERDRSVTCIDLTDALQDEPFDPVSTRLVVTVTGSRCEAPPPCSAAHMPLTPRALPPSSAAARAVVFVYSTSLRDPGQGPSVP